ncbi:TonB-dependent receptor [candidate division KSB1 bacterium]|nr:TonB-dependent receptor [candidate division KSB1 bacterium]RQW07336.1 MAG: TonB-dependent receptor [candidate division KSB1 bacterium]
MRRLGVGILFLFCLSAHLFAQTTGKITGTIKDGSTGEDLIGVNVVLEGTYMGAASDLEGTFFILNVPPGKYTVKFMLIGYTTKVVEGVSVSVNRTTPIDVTLDATTLDLGEEVVVTADRIAVKKDQTSSIRNVSAEEMDVLPIESTGAVVALQPGVVQGHFRGGRSNEQNVMIDGVSVQSGLNRGSMVSVDPDAVQEVEVITGTFSAKYGEAMSGIVNMVTKEGGDRFSGKLEGYFGNYLTQHNDVYIGLKAGEVDRNEDYKFMLEGPIVRNKLNFFVSGRVQDNDGYLNGIRRFNITDEPDYSQFQDSTQFVNGEYLLNEHTGDSSYVPMSWMEAMNLNAKLTYRSKNIKTSLMYLYNDGTGQGYSHSQMYKPDGRSRWHDRSDLWTLQLNHVLGQRLFYELKFSYTYSKTGSYLYESPLDPNYLHDRYSANQSYTGFLTGGQDKGHSTNTTKKMLGRLDLTWQATNNHSIEMGAEAVKFDYDQRWHQILNAYRNTQASAFLYAPQIMPDSSVYADVYFKKPEQAAVWLSDKMEFDAMVVDLGVRAEYFDPKTVYPTNYRNPNNLLQKEDTPEWISKYPDADAKFNVAPRLGLSYQLGETALLRFSYGHFYQYPPHSTMYQNNSYVLSPTNYSSTLGNPQVEPEMTVTYEIGLWQMLNQWMDLEVALWYKDIYNLSTVNIQTTYNALRYGLYGNKDYGNARGLELKYKAHVQSFFAEVNYTLQYTRGNADNPQFTFNRAGNSQDPIPTLIPMSWDQRHTANLTAGYNKKNWGATVTGWLGSGSAYTWSPIDQNPLNRVYLFPNNSSKPFHYTFDLKANYDFQLRQNYRLRLTLYVYNLFDRLNEDNVNANTGRTNQAIIRPQDRLGHWSDFSTYEQRIYSPSNWSSPRLVKLGLGFFF